jgi:protein TonB
MDNYAAPSYPPRQHGLGIALVIVLHLLLLWAIQSGLARVVTQKAKVVVEAVLLSEDKPAIPPPPPKNLPPPPKNVSPPPAYVPPVEVPVTVPAPANAISAVANTPSPPAPAVPAAPAPKAEPVRTAAVVSSTHCEKPEYPSASRRLEEEGTVHLRFLVGVDGKVIQSEVEKSSGYKRLDEAARAGLSRCQFRPATVDGKAEQAWASMRYTWRLE